MPRPNLTGEKVSDAGHMVFKDSDKSWQQTSKDLSKGIKKMIQEGRIAPANALETQLRKDWIAKNGNRVIKKSKK